MKLFLLISLAMISPALAQAPQFPGPQITWPQSTIVTPPPIPQIPQPQMQIIRDPVSGRLCAFDGHALICL